MKFFDESVFYALHKSKKDPNLECLTETIKSLDFSEANEIVNAYLVFLIMHNCSILISPLLSLNYKFDMGFAVCVAIAQDSHTEIMRMLLEKNPDLSYENNLPLKLAIYKNNPFYVDKILHYGIGIDINADDSFPLRLAVESNFTECVEVLIKCKAFIPSERIVKLIPTSDIAKVLIEAGFDTNAMQGYLFSKAITFRSKYLIQKCIDDGVELTSIGPNHLLEGIAKLDSKTIESMAAYGLIFQILMGFFQMLMSNHIL